MGKWFLGNALNSSLLLSHNITQMSFREYKIFCVNEKIHTKKEVPSVE